MPYSTPAAVALPSHSNGRPGHRRSYSHIVPAEAAAFGYTSTSSSLGALPRRRSASGAAVEHRLGSSASGAGASGSGNGNGVDTDGKLNNGLTNAPMTNGTTPTTTTSNMTTTTTAAAGWRKPTFQLGRDDDDDSSSDEQHQPHLPRTTVSPPTPTRGAPSHSTTTTLSSTPPSDDDGRALPPLRLRVKATHLGSFGAGSVPFPRSSPTHSPSASATNLVLSPPAPAPQLVRSESYSSPYSPGATPTSAGARALRPSVSRTSSSPVLLLSNGKPLKSSLKGSLSSSHIPFPPQSMVPSRMGSMENAHLLAVAGPVTTNGHQRAASAPSTPMSDVGSSFARQAALSVPAPPQLGASISEGGVRFPSSASGSSSTSSTPPRSPSPSYSEFHTHEHLHAPSLPKNVHFPSSDEGPLATIKLFNRSARPASLSRLGEETETETEGEGSAREGSPALGSWGGWMGNFGGGFGRWNARQGAAKAAAANAASGNGNGNGKEGYPFPKVGGSGAGANGSPLKKGVEEEKGGSEEEFAVDMAHSSPVPMRGAERGEGNVYLESVGFVKGSSSGGASQLTLGGTLLVRNVTYQKSVAVRFTLDDWHTTNDVVARYDKSLGALPGRFVRGASASSSPASSPSSSSASLPSTSTSASLPRVCHPSDIDALGDALAAPGTPPAWDRFRFEIALEGYRTGLAGRVMWLVGRYSAGAGPGADGAPAPAQGAPGPGQEWWDNNCGGNYRIGFERREVERKGEEEGRGAYKRGVIVSAPSAYTPASRPTATSPPPKSYPAPPQISSSVSFPGSGSPSPASYAQHQQHQTAVAQSTIARLKKLNLRNYAAPAGYTGVNGTGTGAATTATSTAAVNGAASHRSPSTASVESSSTSTSTDSTPLQTPTQDDDGDEDARVFERKHNPDVDVLSSDDEHLFSAANNTSSSNDDADRTPTFRGALARPSWGADGELGMEMGMGMGMSLEHGFPATRLRSPPPPRADDIMMSSSPPFSSLAETMGSPASASSTTAISPPPSAGAGSGASLYWPWGSFGDMASKTSVSEKEPAAAARDSPSGKENAHPAPSRVFESVGHEKNSSGAIMPPQRKRGVHHGHGHHHHHPRDHAHFSLGGAGSSSSSLSSTGSGSDSGAATPNGRSSSSSSAHQHSSVSSPKPVPARATAPALVRTSSNSSTFSPSSSPSSSQPPLPAHRSGSPSMWALRPGSPRPAAALGATGDTYPGSPKRFVVGLPGSSPGSGYGMNGGYGGIGGARGGSGARSPLRLSPVNSSAALESLLDGGAAERGGVLSPLSPSLAPQAFTKSSNSNSNSTSTITPSASSSSLTSPTGAGQDDAIYQAFVRQWCFAQAPGPTVGASVGGGASSGGAAQQRGAGEGRLVVS